MANDRFSGLEDKGSLSFILRSLRQNLQQPGDLQASLAFREKPFSLLSHREPAEWPANTGWSLLTALRL